MVVLSIVLLHYIHLHVKVSYIESSLSHDISKDSDIDKEKKDKKSDKRGKTQ